MIALHEGIEMLDAMAHLSGSGAGERESLAEALLMRSETGLIALDRSLCVTLSNSAAQNLLGLCGSVEEDETLASVLRRSPVLRGEAQARAERWLEAGLVQPALLPLDVESTLSILPSPGPDGHLLLELKRVSRAAAPAMRRDPLTGLADRVWFMERLTAALAMPRRGVALLFLDLDRFKAVNDSLGHQAGDALLKLIAKRLTAALREADVICRLSGDEFAIVMAQPNDPEAVGRRLVTLLSRPYLIEGATVSVGASVGVALAPEHASDPATLIRAADVALYAAKNGGRGGARIFDVELDAASRQRHLMSEALRKAIPLRQLALLFQPQIVLETGTLTGFEAFLRWNHPEMGALLPPNFLPIAEDSGLIWAIGEWVLRQACEEALTWPSHLSVSVNVSQRQLVDRQRLPRMIKSVLLRTGLAPQRLEIEVPESALTQQPEALAVLTAIDALGVRISLDDFGTGYSSLNHLRRFPLHKLKIDKSLIHALGESDEATNVVRAIAALGRTLGIVTVAEGVETTDQQNRLQCDGCMEMQGYVLSKPVPACDVGAMITGLQASVPRTRPVM